MPADPERPTSKPERLPAGRHGLDPEFVAANQRERLIDAIPSVVAMTGFHAMTIEDIVARAGVSRSAFYAHFDSKDEVFLAAYDQAIPAFARAVQRGADEGEGFADAAHRALAAAIEFVLAEPAIAMMCLVEILAVGPAGIERRNRATQNFVALLERAAATLPPDTPAVLPLTTQTVVGGISEVAYNRLVQGKTAELPGLVPDLLYSMLMPFVGHEPALADVQRLTGERTASR